MAIPIPVGINEGQAQEDAQTTGIPITSQESADAASQLSAETTPVLSLARSNSLDDLRALDPHPVPLQTLNERYPDVEPFKEDLPPFVAEEIASRLRERARLNRIIELGPDQGFRNFVAGLTPQALDPISFAASAALGAVRVAAVGINAIRGAGFAVQGTKHAFTAGAMQLAGKTAAQKFVGNFVEGVAGNIAAETFNINANTEEGRDFDAVESLVNVSAGAGAFAGISYGVSKLARLPKWALSRLEERATEQRMSGRIPDVTQELKIISKDFPPVDPNKPLPESVLNEIPGTVPGTATAKEVLDALDAAKINGTLNGDVMKRVNQALIEEGHQPHFKVKEKVDVEAEIDAIENGPNSFDKADQEMGLEMSESYKTPETVDMEKDLTDTMEAIKEKEGLGIVGKSAKAAQEAIKESAENEKWYVKILRSAIPCERGNM